MSSLQAWQDRLQRPIVFEMWFQVLGQADPKGALIRAVCETGARVTDVGVEELDEETDDLICRMTLFTTGDEQMAAARKAAEGVAGVKVLDVLDVAMESHRGGVCEMVSSPIESNTDLRILYTPGVARVCKAVQAEPALAYEYTGIGNTVAIVTNGTAILGLGDIGCVAGMPVMEGKSAIFHSFARISAVPILVETHEPEEFIETVVRIASTFGAIQVEDVKAPECFRITSELDRRLPIPVMHDDQHGTGTIVLAGLYGALRKTGKHIKNLRCAISGAGASGTGITDLLQRAGIGDVILCDSKGIVCRARTDLNEEKRKLAERTNRENRTGTLADAMKGADLFIGCSQPNLVSQEMVRLMAKQPILFPLANPVSEIGRADALQAGAAIYADGRYMNNAIAYPGIFRGALDARAEAITFEMMLAASEALADLVSERELLPEMMDPATHAAVATAVQNAAKKK